MTLRPLPFTPETCVSITRPVQGSLSSEFKRQQHIRATVGDRARGRSIWVIPGEGVSASQSPTHPHSQVQHQAHGLWEPQPFTPEISALCSFFSRVCNGNYTVKQCAASQHTPFLWFGSHAEGQAWVARRVYRNEGHALRALQAVGPHPVARTHLLTTPLGEQSAPLALCLSSSLRRNIEHSGSADCAALLIG